MTYNKTRIHEQVMENITGNKDVWKEGPISTVLLNFISKAILTESGIETNGKIYERCY